MISEFTKKQGKRLAAMLKSRHITQREMCDKFLAVYGAGSAKVIFSDYCRGKRGIPTPLLIDIANELNIDAGYLIGYDKFFVDTYEEYTDFMKQMKNTDFEKYDSFFKHAELWLSSDLNYTNHDEIVYHLFSYMEKKTKSFPAEDMLNFYNLACKMLSDLFMEYISYDEYEKYIENGSVNDWVHFLKWHENFLKKMKISFS